MHDKSWGEKCVIGKSHCGCVSDGNCFRARMGGHCDTSINKCICQTDNDCSANFAFGNECEKNICVCNVDNHCHGKLDGGKCNTTT